MSLLFISEPELIIPISKGIDKLIMIGDPCQLSAVVKNEECTKAGFNQSMFVRLLAKGNKAIILNKQYRMHPFISDFPRNKFYNGLLEDGIQKEDRVFKNINIFPSSEKPVLFYSLKGKEETSFCGHSYLNQIEAYAIGKIVHKLINGGVNPKQIRYDLNFFKLLHFLYS